MGVRAFHYYSDLEVPSSKEGFLTLYFPDEKALEASADKELAQKMLEMKEGTSVKKVKQLAEINPWIPYLITITLKLIKDEQLEVPNSKNILTNLLSSF